MAKLVVHGLVSHPACVCAFMCARAGWLRAGARARVRACVDIRDALMCECCKPLSLTLRVCVCELGLCLCVSLVVWCQWCHAYHTASCLGMQASTGQCSAVLQQSTPGAAYPAPACVCSQWDNHSCCCCTFYPWSSRIGGRNCLYLVAHIWLVHYCCVRCD